MIGNAAAHSQRVATVVDKPCRNDKDVHTEAFPELQASSLPLYTAAEYGTLLTAIAKLLVACTEGA